MTIETWESVPNTKAKYEVSNLGRVRKVFQTKQGEPRYSYLKCHANNYGYLRAPIDGRKVLIHRLVLLAFHGECPTGFEGCHNNGDKADNRLENLRWASRSDNQRDRYFHGTLTSKPIGGLRLTAEKVKDAYLSRDSLHKASERLGVSAQMISNIRRGKSHVRTTENLTR